MQIQVDSHTHTVASGHAYSTLAENVQAAAARGIKLLAVTDHGPAMPGAPHLWFFMNLKVLPRIMDGVGILRGIEANILNIRGEIDADEQALQQLDIVLGSLHDPVFRPKSRSGNTEAVVRAMESGSIDVFAHGGNPLFPIDADEVAAAAAANNVLIEINNSSFTTSRAGSKVNCAVLAEAVARHGGRLTFGSDAHIAGKVGGFEECIAFIRDIGFPQERVLSRSGTQFLQFLRDRHRGVDFSELDELIGEETR